VHPCGDEQSMICCSDRLMLFVAFLSRISRPSIAPMLEKAYPPAHVLFSVRIGGLWVR